MIRLAHLSDLHISEARLPELDIAFKAFEQQAREEEVSLILIAGDVFDKRSTARERLWCAGWLETLARIAPIAGVRGNHDQADEVELFNRLETPGCGFFERPTIVPGSAPRVAGRHNVFGILALPWIDKALVATASRPWEIADQETTRQTAIGAVRGILILLQAEAARVRTDGQIPILVTHCMLGGSVVSTGQVLIGQGIELSPSDLLDVGAAYVACGHIHKEQSWFDGRVAYSGSPIAMNWGEAHPHGYRLVTLTDEGEFVSSEFRELPAPRMVLLEHDLRNDVAGIYPGARLAEKIATTEDIRGARVRYRYKVRPEDLTVVEESALERALLSRGAISVTCEAIVESETRVRSEAIVAATTTWEKVEAYLDSKSVEADREHLREKLSRLETT